MEHYTALVKIAKYWLTDGLVAVLTWSGEHSVQAGEAVGAVLHQAEGGEGGVAAAALRPPPRPAHQHVSAEEHINHPQHVPVTKMKAS